MKIWNVNIIWWCIIGFAMIINVLMVFNLLDYGFFGFFALLVAVLGVPLLSMMYFKSGSDVEIMNSITNEIELLIERLETEDYKIVCKNDSRRIRDSIEKLNRIYESYKDYNKIELYKELLEKLEQLKILQKEKKELLLNEYKKYLQGFSENIQEQITENKLSIFTEVNNEKIEICTLSFSENKKKLILDNGKMSLKSFYIDIDKKCDTYNNYYNGVLLNTRVVDKSNYTELYLCNKTERVNLFQFGNLRKGFMKENSELFRDELSSIIKKFSEIIVAFQEEN